MVGIYLVKNELLNVMVKNNEKSKVDLRIIISAALVIIALLSGGMYVGILLVATGIGVVALKYGQTNSLVETLHTFGYWILIPIMLVVAGVFQIVKCLKNRK